MLGASCKKWVAVSLLFVLNAIAVPNSASAQSGGGEIGDLVWKDLNGDGKQDRSEPGLPNAQVELLDCTSNTILSTTSTDSNGAYRFRQLAPARYRIRFIAAPGYEFSPRRVEAATGGTDSNPDPATGLTYCVSIVDGQVRPGIDAGLVSTGDGTSGASWVGATGGVTVSGNRITYSGTPSGWYRNTVNSAPLSSLGFTGDFEVRWTIDSDPANTVWVVGLGIDETTPDWRDVEFGLRSSGGLLEVRENGTWRTSGPRLSRGSVISVIVRNGIVEYRHNGQPILMSTYSGSPDFYVDTSFKSGAVALDVEFASIATSPGSARLSWKPPTRNEDGSTLNDLAGYVVYWGRSPDTYSNSATINNPGATSYTVEGLTSGTYTFVVTSFNSAGAESSFSAPASKVIP
jgi:hypothetical protein